MPYSADRYTGANFLFQGIAGAGASLGKAIEDFADEQKKLTAAGKSADYFAQAQPDFLPSINATPESWKNLGAKDKAAALDAYTHAQVAKRIAAQVDQYNQLAQDRQALTGFARTYAQEGAPPSVPDLQRYYEATSDEIPPEQMPQQLPHPEIVRRALAANPGAFASHDFDANLKALSASYSTGRDTTPRIVNLRGPKGEIPVVHSPGGHGFQVMPGDEAAVTPLMTEDGELLGYQVPGRGGQPGRVIRPKDFTSEFKPANSDGKPLPGVYINPNSGQTVSINPEVLRTQQAGESTTATWQAALGQLQSMKARGAKKTNLSPGGEVSPAGMFGGIPIDDAIASVQARLRSFSGGSRPGPNVGTTLAPPPAEGPLPLPKTRTELQRGALYQTSRGPATWDGEKFVLP